MTDKEIIIPTGGEIMHEDKVLAVAQRLRNTYKPPKNQSVDYVVQPDEFPIVVERAIAGGHFPLAKTYHFWKIDGQIIVEDHYMVWVNWAQAQEPFSFRFRDDKKPSDNQFGNPPRDVEDWISEAVILKDAHKAAFGEERRAWLKIFIDSGVDLDKAMIRAELEAEKVWCQVASGVCKYTDVWNAKTGKKIYGATPPGWVEGVGRAQHRALKNAIRKAYGLPSPAQKAKMNMGQIGTEEALQIAAETPDHIADNPEFAQKYLKQHNPPPKDLPSNGMSKAERVMAMRGDDAIDTDFTEMDLVSENDVPGLHPDPAEFAFPEPTGDIPPEVENEVGEFIPAFPLTSALEEAAYQKFTKFVFGESRPPLNTTEAANMEWLLDCFEILKPPSQREGNPTSVPERYQMIPMIKKIGNLKMNLDDAKRMLRNAALEAMDQGEILSNEQHPSDS